jgi:F0F1-type ATP synthase assembly protein I
MLLDPKMTRFYALLSSAAISKAILIALGYWIGIRLDRRFNTYPLFLFLCIVFALGVGIWGIVKVAESMNREDK